MSIASNVASTAACIVAGAVAGQSVHKVPESHHLVVRPREELASHLPTTVLPPGWHVCPRLPGVHQAMLVPTDPTEHSVTAHAESRDAFLVEMSSKMVVAPDPAQLASDSSCALGGPELVGRAVDVVGRRALTELVARLPAKDMLAAWGGEQAEQVAQAGKAAVVATAAGSGSGEAAAGDGGSPFTRTQIVTVSVESQLRGALSEFGLQLVSFTPGTAQVEGKIMDPKAAAAALGGERKPLSRCSIM